MQFARREKLLKTYMVEKSFADMQEGSEEA
jgi:hypothetical protein